MYFRRCAPSEDSWSSLGAFWLAKDAKFLHADNEDWGSFVLITRSSFCWSKKDGFQFLAKEGAPALANRLED